MKEITLVIDWSMHEELEAYLRTLKGVRKVEIGSDYYWTIHVQYDSARMNANILKYEIYTFLKVGQIPIMVRFDKYPEMKVAKRTVTVKHLCCEFCYAGFIENLYAIDGIEKVTADMEEVALRECVNIEITYDVKKLDENKIDKIVKENRMDGIK